MTPLDYFNSAWSRCSSLETLHIYLSNNLTRVISTDELLRAEWVARISALDLYAHELIAQNMLAIFENRRPATEAYLRFQISNETIRRIQNPISTSSSSAAFDLEIREKLSYQTFQDPEKIAEGVRLISSAELWNMVALHLGAAETKKVDEAKKIKLQLSLLVLRRNKIAHEGDLQPSFPREPWPIERKDVDLVRDFVQKLVSAINHIVQA